MLISALYSKFSYVVWKQNGKPRGDDTDMDMRATRLRFKYALRQCRCDEEHNRAEALALSLHCKDTNYSCYGDFNTLACGD